MHVSKVFGSWHTMHENDSKLPRVLLSLGKISEWLNPNLLEPHMSCQ